MRLANESAPESSPSLARELEQVIARFEAAWQDGRRPALEDYLPYGGPERRRLLIELVHADLEFRLEGGEAVSAADYLGRFPELAQEQQTVLDLLTREYELRRRRAELVPEAFAGQYPAYADGLRERLRAVEQARADTKAGEEAVIRHDGRHGPPARRRAAPRAADWPAVPGYEVLGVLGWGGMAIVYKAHHLRLNRMVALKMVLEDSGANFEDLLRFLGEAEAVAAIRHEGIVQVYEVGQHNKLPYLSLEFCEGGSLAAQLHGGPLPARDAARLVEAAARAVHAAHLRGIIHRDLKPGNVLLTADGCPKVTDFGLAKRVLCGPGLTLRGAVMGTPAYMAPEQARGDSHEVGPTADVYALGAVLYECLAGRPPFRAATNMDTLVQVMMEDPVPVRRLRPETPRDLETICLKALAKEPAQRYASAQELADDLERWQAGQPIRGRSVGLLEKTWRWCRRNPLAACLAAALGLLLLTGSVVTTALWQRVAHLQQLLDQSQPPEPRP